MKPLRLSLADAWERFDSFHDTLIHSVELDFRPHRDHRADIEIDGWERDEVTSTWSGNAVHFHFDGVKEYRFWEKNWAMEVVKGAAWAKLDDLILGRVRRRRHPHPRRCPDC